MDVTFICPNCKQELEADTSLAGTQIQCPSCGNALTIPEPDVQNVKVVNPIASSAVKTTTISRMETAIRKSGISMMKTSIPTISCSSDGPHPQVKLMRAGRLLYVCPGRPARPL